MARAILLNRPSPFAYPGVAPGFDRSHPASLGVAYSGVSVGANFVNILRATSATPTTVSGAITGQGVATRFTATASAVVVAGVSSTTAFATQTVAAIFKVETAGQRFIINSTGQTGSTAQKNGGVALWSNSGALTVRSGTGATDTVVTGLTIVTGVTYFVAASVNGTACNVVLTRLDTGAIQSVAVTIATPTAGDANLCLGQYAWGGFDLRGVLSAAMLSYSFLSLPTLLQWARDPWAFWYPKKLDLSLMLYIPSSGGTVNPKTLTATCTSTSTLSYTSSFLRTLTASCTSTSTLVRSVAKTLLATCTSTSVVSAIKAKLLTLVATCTSTSSLVTHSTFARTLVATCTSTSVLIRSIAKKLITTCTSTSIVFGARAFSRTLIATCTSTSTVLAHKCITYFQTVTAVCTSTALVSAIKSVAGSVASLASKLRPYKPVPAPVIPGNDTLYLLNELQKVSNAFNAHVAATKDLDARLKAAGW